MRITTTAFVRAGLLFWECGRPEVVPPFRASSYPGAPQRDLGSARGENHQNQVLTGCDDALVS